MSKKLYVGNIPFSATEDSLKDAFLQFGTVESVTIITDSDTGKSKGFGFLELASQQEADNAIGKMNGCEMGGQTLKVSEAKPKVVRDSGPRRSQAGGFGQ